MGDLKELHQEVLDRATPSEDEEQRVMETVERVKSVVSRVGDEMDVEVAPRTVGSVARDTWTSGDRDIDIFMLLPKDLETEEFRKLGLELARKTAEEGDSYVEEFAEHPYITARFGEFDVDIVPCYNVDSYREVTSAVDRTPLHDDYLSERLDPELKDSVRLLKRFMKGIGVYGAEFKVGGFSGYLTELLALNYKSEEKGVSHPSFIESLEKTSRWRYGMEIDIEGHGSSGQFDGALVVVDPVDPNRNVAAALTKKRWAEYISACYTYLKNPSIRYFYPPEPTIHDTDTVKSIIRERDTNLVLIEFERPDVVDDTLYPQLRKTSRWLKSALEEEGFDVIRTDIEGESGVYVLVETQQKKLSSVEKHFGPPVTAKKHSESFLDKYLGENIHSGPYIEGDRWVVERKKTRRNPEKIIMESLREPERAGVGKDLQDAEITIYKGIESVDIASEFLSRYLVGKPIWLKPKNN